ncbi:hypothetical protein [Xylophilus sp.]|uniref:hypothetical protein n=1 Tax=Xylophilus sp. TaxID=2653893 RepID=UPI002D7EE1D6|nr:hypothetical protein [Xylophilus sp.]
MAMQNPLPVQTRLAGTQSRESAIEQQVRADATGLPGNVDTPGDAPSLPENETREFVPTHPGGDARPSRSRSDPTDAPSIDLAQQRAKAGVAGQRTTEDFDRGEVAREERRRQEGV